MTRRFRFCYVGQNDHGEHWGRLTDLDKLNSQIGRYRPVGSANRIIVSGVSRDDLMNRVTEYVRNIPGNRDVELTMDGTTVTIHGTRGK